MNTRPIAEIFTYIHTYFRQLKDIHKDDKQLESCFTNDFRRTFDKDSIAAYAFNLPSIAFQEKNEVFMEIAEEALSEFSSIVNTNPIFFYAFVGQGKTTYLKYLINIRVFNDPKFESLRKKTYFIYLAYTSDDDQCSQIKRDLYSEITIIIDKILKEHEIKLKDAYEILGEIFPAKRIEYEYSTSNPTLKNFLEYILADKDIQFFNRSITKWLLKVKKIKICCIVDNIDQHFKFFNDSDYGLFTQFFQTVMSYDLQPIIPLRISNKGFQSLSFFESYNNIPINMGVPDFGKVLEKRINYLKKYYITDLKNPTWIKENGSYLTTDELFDTIQSIVNLINLNEPVKYSLHMLSNNITREYLRIMVNIFSSYPLFNHPLSGEDIDYSQKIKSKKFNGLFIYAIMLRNNQQFQENDDVEYTRFIVDIAKHIYLPSFQTQPDSYTL